MIEFKMDPQQALDAPRFCIGPGHTDAVGAIALEEGIPDMTMAELKKLGHKISHDSPVTSFSRALFGRGQIVAPVLSSGGERVLAAGSDPRADGCAMGW